VGVVIADQGLLYKFPANMMKTATVADLILPSERIFSSKNVNNLWEPASGKVFGPKKIFQSVW
jgi:hypothetical protein